MTLHEAKRDTFTQKTTKSYKLPQTEDTLIQHKKSAVVQATNILGHFATRDPSPAF